MYRDGKPCQNDMAGSGNSQHVNKRIASRGLQWQDLPGRCTMPELNDADRKIVVDELCIRLSYYKNENDKIKASGWSGTGTIGYAISRINEIIAKLEG